MEEGNIDGISRSSNTKDANCFLLSDIGIQDRALVLTVNVYFSPSTASKIVGNVNEDIKETVAPVGTAHLSFHLISNLGAFDGEQTR